LYEREKNTMTNRIHWRVVGDERGAVALFVVLGIVVFVGMMALAVDLGMMMTARTEAQRTADGAALAGAASLITQPGDQTRARLWAKQWAGYNPVRKQTIALRDQDIDVFNDTVRVRVLRTTSYGSPVATIFARLVGINNVDIAASAAAEATEWGAGAECLLPVAIPWPWIDGDSNPEFDSPPDVLGPALQVGDHIVLKPSQGGQGGGPPSSTRLTPGFWDLWLPNPFSGVPPIRDRIWGCVDGDPPVFATDDQGNQMYLYREAGNKQTIAGEFDQLVQTYAHHQWVWTTPPGNPNAGGCVIDTSLGSTHTSCNNPLGSSPRHRPAPLFDPNTYTQQGSGPHFAVLDIIGVWIDSVNTTPLGQQNVYATIVPFQGVLGGGAVNGPTIKALRLVE
jgi:hypothetical protein